VVICETVMEMLLSNSTNISLLTLPQGIVAIIWIHTY